MVSPIFARMGTFPAERIQNVTVKEIERLIFITREIERMKTDIYYLLKSKLFISIPCGTNLVLVGTFVYEV